MNDTAAIQGIKLDRAAGAADMEHVRALFEEYQAWLGVDLCFQGFEKELAGLPGKYGPPAGSLWLARATASGAVAGGVGMRPLDEGRCEMKRLYVRPPWRGRGLGRRLAELVVEDARRAGYGRMCLDTLGHLNEAKQLYRSMGFVEIPSYYDNPLDDVTYMEMALAS